MKKSIYFLLCLLIASVLSVTGQNTAKINRQTELLKVIHGQSNVDIKLSSEEMASLKHLKFTRELVTRTTDPSSRARFQRQMTKELRQLLDPAAASTSKSKINTPSLKSITSANPDALGNNFQTNLNKSFHQSALLSKAPKTGVMKYQLDSMVTLKYDQSSWIGEGKQIFEYNYNGWVTKNVFFNYSENEETWNPEELSMITYDEQGRMTGYVRKSSDNVLGEKILILRDSVITTYDDNGNTLSEERYSEFIDEQTGNCVFFGDYKEEQVYNQDGQQIEGIAYEWDWDAHVWNPDSKHESLWQDGRELLAAAYSWDNQRKAWKGDWKFENFPLQGYNMLESIHYGWDDVTNDWYINSKEEYEIGQNEHGAVITATTSYADYETKILSLAYRTIYSEPVVFVNSEEDHFKSVVLYKWMSEIPEWVWTSKANKIFDAAGNLLVGVDSVWVYNGASTQHQWVISSRVDNTINTEGAIVEALQTQWTFDHLSGTNTVFKNGRELMSYTAKNQQLERIYQEWDFSEQAWTNISRFTNDYDAAGNVVLEESYGEYNKGTSTWIPSQKQEYSFNLEGEQTSYAYYNWVENTNSWRRIMKSGYEEDANGRVISESYINWSYELDTEVINYLAQYEYDDNGNLISESKIESNSWFDENQNHLNVYGDKKEYAYDSNNKLISQTDYKYQNNEFVKDRKTAYVYDVDHPAAVATETYYSWNNGIQDWELGGKGELTSNFNIPGSELLLPFGEDSDAPIDLYFNWMPLELTASNWNANTTDWDLSAKTVLYYTLTEFSSTENINTAKLLVGPNPVTDFLSITLPVNVQQAHFKMFDVQGRVVTEKIINGNMQVDISNINKGIYFYQLITDSGSYKGKLIKN